MDIDIRSLLQVQGETLAIEIQEKEGLTLEDFGSYHFPKPLSFEGELASETSGILRLRGEIRLFYQSECVRCLRPVEEEVTIPVDEEIYPLGYQADLHKRFALGEPDAEQEEELTDPEELLFHDKKKLEIAKLLQDQALLALPIGVYCDSACPGLCPSCGRRRDDPQCHCEDVADNNSPFDKLRELL